MIFGVDVSQHQLTWDELLARTQFAEDAGFESAWVFDHFTPLYGDPGGPCLEAYTALAALAALTSRIRLGALVTGVTYRHPSLLAAEVAAVDQISGGRMNLGIGAAWHAPEHERLGMDFPPAKERAGRLEEAIQVVTLLWTEDDADFDGRYYHLRGGYLNPKPVQRPRPPVWVGAGGERLTLPIVGRRADVWHWFGATPELVRKWEIVRRAAEEAGRDPGLILRSTNLSLSEPWDQVRRRVDELASAGVSHVIASWPAEGRARIEEFAADVLPALSGGA
jgi:F420-dependent oxidoreductase-like protein